MKADNQNNYIGSLTEPTLLYQKSIADMQAQTAAMIKSIKRAPNLTDIVSNMQRASQIKVPEFSKDVTASVIPKAIIDQFKEVSNLYTLKPQLPDQKLMLSVLKSATLANRLSFSSSILNKDLLSKTVKESAIAWNFQQNKIRKDSNLQSITDSQATLSNTHHLTNEVESNTKLVEHENIEQKNLGEDHKEFAQIVASHKLPPLMDMLNIAQYILLAMQIFDFDDKYIQLAYIALTSFIMQSYFKSTKQ